MVRHQTLRQPDHQATSQTPQFFARGNCSVMDSRVPSPAHAAHAAYTVALSSTAARDLLRVEQA